MEKLHRIKWVIVLTLFWVVLNSSWSVDVIVMGIILSVLALMFTDKFLLGKSYSQMHNLNILKLLNYLIFLLKEVYVAGFEMIIMIFTGKVDPVIVEIETTLKEDYQRLMLANSITITPGTITVDLSDNILKVLWIYKKSSDPKIIKESICESIEKRLENL